MSRRNYRSSMEFIERGFSGCWHNARDLVKGAKLLLDNKFNALALSTSVLALEELGKLFLIDGLLFAKPGDYKATAFSKSYKSHSAKLSAFELFPMFLSHLSATSPVYEKDSRFRQATAICLADLRDRGNVVLSLLKDSSFQSLDQWKQSGFYSQPQNNSFVIPAEAISREIAEAVYHLAWRASTTLDFLLKDGNLEQYMAAAHNIRSKLSEKDHLEMEEHGKQLAAELFSEESCEPKPTSH